MSSKIIQVPDIEEIKLPQFLTVVPKAPTHDVIAFEKQRIQRNNGDWQPLEEGEQLQVFDKVRLKSEVQSGNLSPNLTTGEDGAEVILGEQLFDPGVEMALAQQKVGDNFTYGMGDGQLSLDIVEAWRAELPELTDEMVKKEGIPRVETVEQLEAALTFEIQYQQMNQYFDQQVFPWAREEILNRTEFDIDREELDKIVDGWLASTRQAAAGEGLDFYDFLRNLTGQPQEQDKEKLEQDAKDFFEEDYKFSMILDALGRDEEAEVTEEDFEKFVEQMVAQGFPEDMLRAQVSMDEFKRQTQQKMALDRFVKHLVDQLER